MFSDIIFRLVFILYVSATKLILKAFCDYEFQLFSERAPPPPPNKPSNTQCGLMKALEFYERNTTQLTISSINWSIRKVRGVTTCAKSFLMYRPNAKKMLNLQQRIMCVCSLNRSLEFSACTSTSLLQIATLILAKRNI